MSQLGILLLAILATSGNENQHKEQGLEKTASEEMKSYEMNYRSIAQDEARRIMRGAQSYVVIDVRTPEEYQMGHITGAINIPNESIMDEPLGQVPDRNQVLFVYCGGGGRSKRASQKLADIGYRNVYEMGGMDTWTGSISR